jgi:hypothetical protein
MGYYVSGLLKLLFVSFLYSLENVNIYIFSSGGYRCSVRAVTNWENASFIFEHPNYYSKYMDQQMQADFKTYTFWKNMMWPPLFNKSRILDQHAFNQSYRYTNEGWRRFGV